MRYEDFQAQARVHDEPALPRRYASHLGMCHLMIAPYDHERNFERLQSETQVEMMNLMSQSMEILKNNLNADGFNFGANFGEVAGAGIKEHLHFHLVPRWIGDTNFMPVMGHTKVMVDGLKETRKKLAEAFAVNGK